MWSWMDHGLAAGVNPGFIMALSVAGCFSITFAVTAVMPDKARMFSLGVVEGIRLAESARTVDPEPTARTTRHLSIAP